MYLTQNSAEWMAFLCLAGIVAAMYRMPRASRPDVLLAFIVFLLGTFGREVVVHMYGMQTWPATAVYLSGLARLFQIIGAAMFIRAAIKERCGEWGWIAIILGTALLAVLV